MNIFSIVEYRQDQEPARIPFFPLLGASLSGALIISFVLLGFGIHTAVEELLYRSLDSTLTERVEGIQHAIEGFEGVVPINDRNAGRFIHFIRDMIEDPSNDDLTTGSFIQIHDSLGGLIVSNRDAQIEGLTDLVLGKPATVSVSFSNGSVFPMRIVREAASKSKPLHLIVTVGRQVDVVTTAVQQMTITFLRVMIPSLLLLVIFVIYLSRRLSTPLTRLVADIGSIEADKLHQAVATNSRVREVHELTTQFNRMLERLDVSFGAQKRFVANVSHQFRTPLAVMAGQIQILLAHPRDTASYREIMESNLEEIRQLNHLLDILLNLERLEARAPDWTDMVDLSVLASEVIEDFSLVAESRNCIVETTFPPLPQVAMDMSLVRQALINLFDNATKYARIGGNSEQVRVRFETGIERPENSGRSSRAISGRVWFRSTNWGPIIPEHELSHVGERFFRGKSMRHEGTGLGLSLVFALANLHNGSVTVTSDVTKGTSFTLFLPVILRESPKKR